MGIPFDKIGNRPRKSSELERDRAVLALVGYLGGLLSFPETISGVHREEVLQRVNAVRRAHGLAPLAVTLAPTAEVA